MSEILFRYERIDFTSWAYLSSLLTIALYFKFNRLLSVRNLDLCGLILLAPGLLLVQYGTDPEQNLQNAPLIEHIGYIWLLLTQLGLLGRLLIDNSMVRRPLLEPNMSTGGITFLAGALFLFLMANVITGRPSDEDVSAAREAGELGERRAEYQPGEVFKWRGPGFYAIFLIPHIVTSSTISQQTAPKTDGETPEQARQRIVNQATARVMAILCQLMIVIGMISIGRRHFDNIGTGLATAQLYLLLPYTAIRTGIVTDSLPAALIVWAVVTYRRPMVAGALIGLAIGATYFPIFLLPLWIGFYWLRGRTRFLCGVLGALAVVISLLALTSPGWGAFLASLRAVFGVRFPYLPAETLGGVWKYWFPVLRLPILVTFLAMCLAMIVWPAQKNLGTLLSLSAAVMLGTQFWHPTTTGLAMAWYLPLVLLTVFRPNLEDRYALAVVPESRRARRRAARALKV